MAELDVHGGTGPRVSLRQFSKRLPSADAPLLASAATMDAGQSGVTGDVPSALSGLARAVADFILPSRRYLSLSLVDRGDRNIAARGATVRFGD